MCPHEATKSFNQIVQLRPIRGSLLSDFWSPLAAINLNVSSKPTPRGITKSIKSFSHLFATSLFQLGHFGLHESLQGLHLLFKSGDGLDSYWDVFSFDLSSAPILILLLDLLPERVRNSPTWLISPSPARINGHMKTNQNRRQACIRLSNILKEPLNFAQVTFWTGCQGPSQPSGKPLPTEPWLSPIFPEKWVQNLPLPPPAQVPQGLCYYHVSLLEHPVFQENLVSCAHVKPPANTKFDLGQLVAGCQQKWKGQQQYAYLPTPAWTPMICWDCTLCYQGALTSHDPNKQYSRDPVYLLK
jgi:hypothetical protein